jgi:large repetitive protein
MAIPTVTTQAADLVGATVARGNGTVSDDGGHTITERGVCIKTSANPTTADTKFTTTGTTGVYTVAMSSLTVTQLYYAKAYAINSDGTAYGSQVTFTTGTPTPKPKLVAMGLL